MPQSLLSSHKLARLHDCLNVVASTGIGVSKTAQAAVEQLQLLLPSDSAVLGYRKASNSSYFGFARPHDYPVADYGEAYQAHVSQHPFVEHFTKHPGAAAVRFSDVVSESVLRDRAIHSEFFKPLRIKRLLGKVVPVGEFTDSQFEMPSGFFAYGSAKPTFDYSCISVGLGRESLEFTDEEMVLFDIYVNMVSSQLMRELTWELECYRLKQSKNSLASSDDSNLLSIAAEFKLTNRQCEVLHWVGEGKTNPEIAIILGNSQRTIQTHVEAILKKMRVENRVTAARMLWTNEY